MAHPLDPLTADEFSAVASILQRDHGVGAAAPATSDLGWRYASVELAEPSKTELKAFDDGGPPPERRAQVICLQRSNNATYKSVVSLTADRAESFEYIPGVQANFTVDEFVECDRLLRTHPDLIAALAKRGITEMELVFFDTWTYGDAVAPPQWRDRRLGWSDTWLKAVPGANPYANLVSGLHCVIDLNSMELLRVEDNGVAETPDVMGEYVPSRIPDHIRAASRRDPLKPLHITQPEGPSFTLDGHLLQWQNWSLRIGFNHREGMTLHTVRYRDGDRNRSVAHRLSFAEMIVPYRDPSEDHYRRTAFDIGEWGLGFMTTSLELGCEPVLERASVIGHMLWVTPNHPDERWPAGEFVNQSKWDTGLGRWAQTNRSIENTDVVMWYVFGIHHITRPEDWPVMPVDVVSFWLKPFGFFDRNPSLDVVGSHTSVTNAHH